MSVRSLKVLMLVPALAVAGCDRQAPSDSQPQSSAAPTESAAKGEFNGTLDIANRGKDMPDFTVTDPSGKSLKLHDLKGTPVLVNLWATWCGPCVLEMPMLDKLAADNAGKLRVLTVSQDIEGGAKVAPFYAEKKFAKLEPWLDTENNLGFFYETGMLPTTVLYDAQGKEVWRMIGAHDWSGPRTAAMLAETLEK
ncbi:TlpA family protein disulfide reductase [Novosphingobium taihuense]|uniref:Thiol-disulfide isomerase/thioredoxin n=1 Tax=Novosphingobium taihuense TaxID=260085 RepID=A0A7W7ET61_9SPHN|nr:TlpA disulfide reductase family protein [Novosphingobium taihuense]MBB4612932.1 thiol-disulfide isomerase/thioredoxin [Novosphingobium taihuense]